MVTGRLTLTSGTGSGANTTDNRIRGVGNARRYVGTKAQLGWQHMSLYGQALDETREEELADGSAQFRHDLRQPLSTAALLLDHVAGSPSLETAVLARIRESQRQVAWALEMLRDQERAQGAADVIEVGETVVDMIPLTSERCEVTLARPSPAWVRVEPIGLARATRNLLDNGIHAATSSPGTGVVQVTVDRRGDLAVLSIDDSGPGFGRVPTRHGVGLDSVRRFAQRWGGLVTIGASTLGGACVELRLPATQQRVLG